MEVLRDQAFVIRGKRSRRSRLISSSVALVVDSSSSSAAGTGEEEEGGLFRMDQFIISTPSEEEQEMANCLILLAQGGNSTNFRCTTCHRCFPSFQALGGHRTSHKKPKPTPPEASPDDKLFMIGNNPTAPTLQIRHNLFVKSKVHECSVCGSVFSSGQALGGHMRRHRPITPATVALPPLVVEQRRNLHYLDLNLPAPEDDRRDSSKFPFASNGEKVIIFSAGSPMVDCHY